MSADSPRVAVRGPSRPGPGAHLRAGAGNISPRIHARLPTGLRWGLDRLVVGLWLLALATFLVIRYGHALIA